MDYHDIAMSIADTIEKVAEPFTADQRLLLTASIAPFLMQRDERIGELERVLRKIAEGGMFSETACIVAARAVLKYKDTL